jgi:signal peptidase I
MKINEEVIMGIKTFLRSKGWFDLPSSGMSMYPLIQQGDVCRFIPIAAADSLKKGDVLLYQSGDGRLIGHRYFRSFTRNNKRYYLLKGDTNDTCDPPITEQQLVGKLLYIKRRKHTINIESSFVKLWTFIVLSYPILPKYCKKVFTLKMRMSMKSRYSE